MKIKSVKRGNIFTQVESVKTSLSRHNLSYPTRFDCEMGDIIPFYVQDVCPGVNMMSKAYFFGRMMPTISPIMQDIDLEVRYFFVPNRLLWDNFEDYILRVGDHIHPMISLDSDTIHNVPYIVDLISNVGNEALTSSSGMHDFELGIDALPYRAYYLIYNEYFRDENVQSELDIDKDKDGFAGMAIDDIASAGIMKCDWRKDYFTSALPWTQRGGMSQFVGDVFLKPNTKLPQLVRDVNGNIITGSKNAAQETDGLVGVLFDNLSPGAIKHNHELVGQGELSYRSVDVTSNADSVEVSEKSLALLDPNGTYAVSFGINELRMANAVQRFLERSALAGNRYTEYIMGMFGVHCSDSRLQRPEYLGGGSVPFTISEVMQNEQAQLDSSGDPYEGSTPQGNLAGIGRVGGTFGFNKPMFFPEFGWVIGVAYLRPHAMYMNGVNRRHIVGVKGINNSEGEVATLENYEIYFNPFFEHIGEQAVFGIELYADSQVQDDFGAALAGRSGWDKTIFGYQSHDAHRKFRNGEIHGEFRSSLKYWTLAREFNNVPQLNDSFLKCDPSDRIFSVEDDSNHFIFEVYNKVDAVLPMSAYGTPRL